MPLRLSWSFFGLINMGMFLAPDLWVFLLILIDLVEILTYELKGIMICFLFLSLKFFNPRILYKSFLGISHDTFHKLLAMGDALVHLSQH